MAEKTRQGKIVRPLDEAVLDARIEEIEGRLSMIDSRIHADSERAGSRYPDLNIPKLTPLLIILLVVTMVAAGAFFLMKPTLTGMTVTDDTSSFINEINLSFNETSAVGWTPEVPGELRGFLIKGRVIGEGKTKVYLDDKLVLDSEKLKPTPNLITGLSISDDVLSDLGDVETVIEAINTTSDSTTPTADTPIDTILTDTTLTDTTPTIAPEPVTASPSSSPELSGSSTSSSAITIVSPIAGARVTNWVTFAFNLNTTGAAAGSDSASPADSSDVNISECSVYLMYRYIATEFTKARTETKIKEGMNYIEIEDMPI
jgi:hypothetical protein